MLKPVVALALLSLSAPALAGECEANFTKSGNPIVMTTYSSAVTVPNLSPRDALAQMRGIMVAEKMDVMAEDAEGGTLLVEQRQDKAARPIPTTITVSEVASGTRIEMAIKMERGVFSKVEQIQPYMCGLFAKVKGGKEGRAAAAQGAKTQNNADVTVKDVYVFSREIAREAKGNAVAVTARHKGRHYALRGRVDYVQEDGQDYNVSFDIPEQGSGLLQVPGDNEPRVGVACLFKPNQLANVLTFRKGDKVTFKGQFLRYDDFKRVLWLQNCVQTR